MIINKTYFVGERYIPHASPSISDNVTGVALDLDKFMGKYERDCLIRSLGRVLYLEFYNQLDDAQPNGLKSGADQKWDDLLNGKDYTAPNGETVSWQGIRAESVLGSGDYDQSFISDYVYWFYQQDTHDTVGASNFQQVNVANGEVADPTPKVTAAWRDFVYKVQGEYYEYRGEYFNTRYGYGVDFYANNNSGDVSMYKFIQDSNELVEDTYADWNGKCWENQNQFGL